MAFLPIVQRELLVTARRRSTFQVRFWTAASAIGVLHFLGTSLGSGGAAISGRWLFKSLAHLDFVLALVAGAWLTADCISREKREGTLGLLFLTDLNGVDVVLGKLTALGMVPIHALLATLPVVSLTLLLGGVTGGEYWRVLLVLLNTLFLSLSLGLWVSSLVTDDRQASGITMGVLFLVTCVPEALAQILSSLDGGNPADWEMVRLAGPWGVFASAFEDVYRTQAGALRGAVVCEHLVAWLFLLSAAGIVRRAWREEDRVAPPPPALEKSPMAGVRAGRRARVAREGPLAWVSWRQTWVRKGAWWIVGMTLMAVLGVFGVMRMKGSGPASAAGTAAWAVIAGFYALKVLAALHIIQFLQTSSRSGALELILVTPVTNRRLCDGHISAMRQLFLWPFLSLGVLHVGLAWMGSIALDEVWPLQGAQLMASTLLALLMVTVHAFDLIAVVYHASRWAFRWDRPGRALIHTIVLVLIVPGIFCNYGRILIDLYIIGNSRPVLERFRQLARSAIFPDPASEAFGAPRGG